MTASRRKSMPTEANVRRTAVLSTVEDAGLLDDAKRVISGRIRNRLVKVAKMRSGIKSTTELIEYALARVAVEDDFDLRRRARDEP